MFECVVVCGSAHVCECAVVSDCLGVCVRQEERGLSNHSKTKESYKW